MIVKVAAQHNAQRFVSSQAPCPHVRREVVLHLTGIQIRADAVRRIEQHCNVRL